MAAEIQNALVRVLVFESDLTHYRGGDIRQPFTNANTRASVFWNSAGSHKAILSSSPPLLIIFLFNTLIWSQRPYNNVTVLAYQSLLLHLLIN